MQGPRIPVARQPVEKVGRQASTFGSMGVNKNSAPQYSRIHITTTPQTLSPKLKTLNP